MTSYIYSEIRATWQVPMFETPLWLGRQYPWCVVIPVINEGERIKNLLARMAALKIDAIADIIIVDGGSTDGSLELDSLKQMGVRSLLVKTGPGNLSAQLRCAYAFALDQGYEGIVTIDGNDKDDPEAIPRFITALKVGFDFVQASRYIAGGVAENTPRLRDFAIRSIHAPMLSLFSGFKWTDTTQGFRAYSRRMLLDPNIAPFRDIFVGYELLAYLSYYAPKLGYRCVELPTIRRYPKGEAPTKINSFKGNLEVLLVLFQACLGAYNKKKYEGWEAMFNKLTIVRKLAVIVSSVMLAALALLASLNITIAPSYPDFIVGNLAWRAGTKLQDLIAAPVFITVFVLSFIFFSFISFLFLLVKKNRLPEQKPSASGKYRTELSHQLILWLLPAIAVSSRLILGGALPDDLFSIVTGQFVTSQNIITPLLISAAGIGFVSIALAYYREDKIDVSPKVLSLCAFAILLIALVPLEIALVLGRVLISLDGEIDLHPFVNAAYAIAVSGLIFGLFYAISNPKKLLQFLSKLLLIGQIGLCAIFLTLYPARLLQPDGVLINYETTVWLNILVVGVILWGVSDVICRYRRHMATNDWTKFLSPVALFALVVVLRAGNTVVPHISPDDFHFGEGLLGWWSFLHGAIPYVDFMPPHGLIDNYMAQFLSFIFYDGSAGSLEEANRIGFVIMAFAAFIAIYLFSGSIGLAFVSTWFLDGRLAFFFLTPFLCLWFSLSLQENPSRWLSVWLLTAPIVILGIPSLGLLLVTASGVLAAHYAWRLWRCPERRAWMEIGVSSIILIVLGFVTPLGQMLLGAIRYVLENALINQVAYGIPWVLSWNTLVFDAIRMSWVAIPIGCLIIIYASVKDSAQRRHILIPAVVVLLFVLLLIPYSMGRIDHMSVSRPGMIAIFGWAILLPVAAWGIVKPIYKVPLILLIACMGVALNFTPLSHLNFVSAMSSKINTPMLRDGRGAGMINIGKAYVQHEHWDRLTRLNALLNARLTPGETYLDLTSRNAQYFYLDRKPVIDITAPYNIVPLSQQKRVVEQLSQNLPRLALLKGDTVIHDGGGLALRNPYLYRFIVDNYIPSYEDGFIIGYRKEHVVADQESTVNVEIRNITDANWDRGFHRLEAAVVLNDPYIISSIKEGDEVHFENGEMRRVIRVLNEDNALWFDGTQMNPVFPYQTNKIQVSVDDSALMKIAFFQHDLHKIPVAWGRSEESLERRMTSVESLEVIDPTLHQLILEDGSYRVNGVNPFLSFDLSGLHLSGWEAGLLKFDFDYVGITTEPRIQVFWWGDDFQEPFEAFSVRFTAGNGALIVPLDASPQWLKLKHIKGIRIDLDNASAGSTFSIKNIGLFQRRF